MNLRILYSTINAEQFNELVAEKDGDPFMVVFTADWLGEGTIMDTIVEQLAEEYQNQFSFYRVDVEQSKEITHQLGIRRLPTMFFFKNGEMVDQNLGMKPKHMLLQKIEDLI